jgi:hypothetical protein
VKKETKKKMEKRKKKQTVLKFELGLAQKIDHGEAAYAV